MFTSIANPIHWDKNVKAGVLTVFFLTIGFLLIVLVRALLYTQQDAVLIVILLLIPILVYLILSDKLLEFKALGVAAKFNATAQKSILSTSDLITSTIEVGNSLVDPKMYISDLSQLVARFGGNENAYKVLTVSFMNNNYGNHELLIYLKTLSRFRNFIFLVILDQDEKVFAYISVYRAIQIIEAEKQYNISPETFSNSINIKDKNKLLSYGLIRDTVRGTEKNTEVLKKMTNSKMDSMIVTDENQKLIGVVNREQLLSNLILSATK